MPAVQKFKRYNIRLNNVFELGESEIKRVINSHFVSYELF